MLSKNLGSSWQPWSWMGDVSQMLRIHSLIIVRGTISNMMLWGSVFYSGFMYLCTTFAQLGKHQNGHYVCSLLHILYIMALVYFDLCHSEFNDTSCYWCVADFRNWRWSVVGIWQTEGCWKELDHCMNLHLCISIDCPSIFHVSSSTFYSFPSVVGPVSMPQFGWWRVERSCRKV